MERILEDLSTPALTAAIRDNLFAWCQYLGRSPAADRRDGPPLTWVLTPIQHPFLNNVLHTQAAPETADRAISDALAYFRSKDVNWVSWWVEPDSRPADLAERLAAHGLTYSEGPPGMAADLQALYEEGVMPPDLTIEPVTAQAGFRLWIEAFGRGYELADAQMNGMTELFEGLGFDLPLRHYVGLLGGKPVTASQLFLGAGVAGIYCVATIPEARRQGLGAAMTLAALRDARALGYRAGILHSSPMGFSVYQRLGFRGLCKMSHYAWRAGLE